MVRTVQYTLYRSTSLQSNKIYVIQLKRFYMNLVYSVDGDCFHGEDDDDDNDNVIVVHCPRHWTIFGKWDG